MAARFPIVLLLAVLLIVGCWPRTLMDVIEPSVKPIAAVFDKVAGTTTAKESR
jgi:NADH:ubiquinone oxidoreductase subunit 4 (subunit M)